MKSLIRCTLILMLGLLATTPALADLKVATSLTDLASVAQLVGGKHVTAQSLCRGYEDPHFVPAKPSLMKAIQHADVFVSTGLELDAGWLPLVLPGSRNPKIQPGAKGFVDASEGVNVLEKPTGKVDASMGDVHPLGNPHFSLDPGLAPLITQTILDGLARLAPDHRAAFERNRHDFLSRLDGEMSRWTKTMEPLKGAKVVVFHPDFIYFVHRFELVQAGTVEDKPGIPPSPQHVVRLIRQIKEEKIKVILVEPWNDVKLAQRIAEEAGAKAIVFASAVGAVKGADNYIAAIDYNIKTLAEALR